jgi:hypothetical protein
MVLFVKKFLRKPNNFFNGFHLRKRFIDKNIKMVKQVKKKCVNMNQSIAEIVF